MKLSAIRLLCSLFAALIFAGGAGAGSRLRFGAAVPLTPVVAPQSINFGQNTLVGHGSVGPVVTAGAITSASCTGTNSGDFTEASDGTFTTTVTPLQASYSLSCTYGNSFGTAAPVPISIVGVPSTYSEASEAELQVTQAISTATMSGRTIAMRWRATPYHWAVGDSTGWFRNKAYTSETTLTSADFNNPATFILGCDSSLSTSCTQLRGTVNLTLDHLRFYAPFYPTWLGTGGHNTSAQANGAAMAITGLATNLTIQNSELYSNWKELVDTYGFAALYQDYVGGCVPTVAGEWPACYTWRGIINPGANLAGFFKVINNIYHDSWRLLQTAQGADSIIISRNEFYNFSADAINVAGSTQTSTEVSWNYAHDILSTTDSSVHLDAFQFIPGINLRDISNVMVFGNRTKTARTDAYASLPNIDFSAQAHFMEDIQPHNYIHAWVFGNWFNTRAGAGVALYNAIDSCVCGNLGVMNPNFGQLTTAPQTHILRQSFPPVTPHDNETADNVSYNSANQIAGDGVVVNNQIADPGASSGPTAYSTLFTGPTYNPSTLAGVLTAFAPVAGTTPMTSVPKMGALGTGYIDYVNRIWDYPRLNTVTAFSFVDATAQPTSTLVTSAGVQINGIVRSDGAASAFGALVRVSNGIAPAFAIASDAGCTTLLVGWTSAPSEAIDAANGNYVCVRDTSSPSAATTTNILVRVGGKSDTWSITTNGGLLLFGVRRRRRAANDNDDQAQRSAA